MRHETEIMGNGIQKLDLVIDFDQENDGYLVLVRVQNGISMVHRLSKDYCINFFDEIGNWSDMSEGQAAWEETDEVPSDGLNSTTLSWVPLSNSRWRPSEPTLIHGKEHED